MCPVGALADGCFVWHWDKKTDINEPAQKAIILYDAGREDLLLQVKYEGSLQEFGWLIPVPSLPKVEKGSMEAFYELSQLTQRASVTDSMEGQSRGPSPASAGLAPVKVIEIKTVGAYEVAVLSARDAGSLARWLKTHDYTIPEGKSGILNDYISRGWFFVAARINTDGPVGLKLSSLADKGRRSAAVQARSNVRKKLAKGELHPLLISFDTPACVFPLKISAVAGKPSEVSVYVLSEQPLLSPFLFDKARQALDQEYAKWVREKPGRERSRLRSWQHLQAMNLGLQMGFSDAYGHRSRGTETNNAWTADDLVAAASEGMPTQPLWGMDEEFYAASQDLLHSLSVTPAELVQSAKSLPRLKNRSWCLTKHVRTFTPEEMRDLEFKPAIPVLAETLARPCGAIAAQVLAGLGSNAIPALAAACKSTNPVVRVNVSRQVGQGRAAGLFEPILGLLKDPLPEVRLRAIQAAGNNWDARYAPALTALFHDPARETRMEAAALLAQHESRERAPAYLAMLKDSDRNVRLCAFMVLTRLNPEAVSTGTLQAMLRSSDEEQQALVLRFLWQNDREGITRADLLPLLRGSFPDTVTLAMATRLIEGTGHTRRPPGSSLEAESEKWNRLSSEETAPLLTNKAAMVRIAGLRILRRNADAKAVELTLPHLREPGIVVRSMAYETLREITGQNFSKNDPVKWDQWWAANKATFVPPPRPATNERGRTPPWQRFAQ